jgi:SAM-dependent methyltransferase
VRNFALRSVRGAEAVATIPTNAPARLLAEPWYLDEVVATEPGSVKIVGWALQDDAIAPDKQTSRFLVNGSAPLTIDYPISRPGVQEVFWHRPGSELSGFVMTAKEDYPDGIMTITCENSDARGDAAGRIHWYVPDPKLHSNVPDPDRRFRVIGNRDLDGFLRLGATDAYRIKSAFERVTGRSWRDAGDVLDWGVGCGRVARHLAPLVAGRFHGCDIDADNAGWCAAHLPGSFAPSRLEPPLPYADESFDVIYGISVFTHLKAPWEERWLAELHRVLRPGGVLMMTVHGQTAIDFANLTPENFRALQARVQTEGLAVTSSNNQLDGFVEHPEEYVNVFHSPEHIRTVWGRHFNDIRQLPGYIFTHDLIVARKA